MQLSMVSLTLISISMKKFLTKISLFVFALLLISAIFQPITNAAVAIDSSLRPDYAPQGYSEVYNSTGKPQDALFDDRSITYIIADIAVVLIQMAGILAIFFLIVSGFNYIKAFGADEEIQKAKKGMTWALIGLIVVIMSYAIVQNVIRISLSVDPSAIAEQSSGADAAAEPAAE